MIQLYANTKITKQYRDGKLDTINAVIIAAEADPAKVVHRHR